MLPTPRHIRGQLDSTCHSTTYREFRRRNGRPGALRAGSEDSAVGPAPNDAEPGEERAMFVS